VALAGPHDIASCQERHSLLLSCCVGASITAISNFCCVTNLLPSRATLQLFNSKDLMTSHVYWLLCSKGSFWVHE
jgi:hypothetical protein